MAEQFHLGFDIDTKPLANAKQAAADAAREIAKLGDAEQSLSQKAGLATEQQKKLEDAIKRTQQAAAQNQGAQQYADSLGRMTGAMSGATSAAAQMAGAIGGGGGGGGLGSALETATGGFGRMMSVLGPTGLVLGATAVAVGVVGKQTFDASNALAKFGDDAALMEARLKNALGSTYAARDAMNQLYRSTQETGTGFSAAADSFLRLARNSEALGATRSEIQTLSDTIQKLGLISGAGRGEIASGMIQLSQALASGRLNGDELRSIMENMPALAKAIADGLGRSVGEMRAMGAAGELTGSKVFAALLSQANKVEEEFKTLPNTAEREFQKVSDAWDKMLKDIATQTNASSWVQGIARAARSTIQAAGNMVAPVDRLTALNQEESDIRRFALVDRSARLAEIAAERQRIQDQMRRDLRTMENDTLQEDLLKQNKPILDASPIAKELDDRASKISKVTGEIKSLEAGIAALQAKPTLTETDTKQLEQFNRALLIAQKQLSDTKTPVEALASDFGKLSAAIAQGGGGGATALIQQAQKLSDAMRSQGLSGGGGALGTLIQQEVMRGGDQIRTLEMQVRNQQALTGALGGTREATREVEIANDVLLKRFQMFGDLKSPVIDGFFNRLTVAMREQKLAADAAAVAQANYASALEASISKAQGGAAGNSGLQRAIAASMRAAEADRLRPGTFGGEMDRFNAAEALNAQNQLAGIQQNIALQRVLAGSMGTDRERQLAQLGVNADAALRALTPQARAQFGDQIVSGMREQDRATFDANRANEVRGLRTQIGTSQRRAGLIGLTPEELRVQTAILEKQLQLEQLGLQAGQEQYDTQVALTEQLARQNVLYDRQRAIVDGVFGAVDGVASGMKSSFVDAFERSFQTGENAAEAFFKSFGDMTRRAAYEMTYEIAVKPLVTLAANAAKMGLSNLFNLGGSNLNAPGGSNFGMDLGFDAKGNAYGSSGRITAFANGGVFTNGIFSQPTLFRFGAGGSFGVMGEAGPEAVMPLRRGSDGKLGVAASGGGDVQIIVNDMRSSRESAPVEATSTTGPSGIRQIQIMVRDEIRRSMAAGEFDRTMQTNFGTSRQIARK